jgi:hypothetical protein
LYVADSTPVPLAASPSNTVGSGQLLMTLAPEDHTLFIAGDAQIVVVPLP